MDTFKIRGQLGTDTVEEMDAMAEDDLQKVVVSAESAMKQVKEEMEANPKYQEAKQNVSALSQGKKDVDKRQKAKIQYALSRLEELGSMDPVSRIDWNIARQKSLAIIAKKKELAAAEKAAEESETNNEDEGN